MGYLNYYCTQLFTKSSTSPYSPVNKSETIRQNISQIPFFFNFELEWAPQVCQIMPG